MLEAHKLSRRFGAHYLFQDMGCSFNHGCHAISGENGAGKSTLLRTLAGVDAPDGGDVIIDGISLLAQPVKARQRIFYVPDRPVFYEHMRGEDFISTVLRLRGLKRDALGKMGERFRLEPLLKLYLRDMSLGMQRRLYFALALIGEGAILLDEPSNGLDGGFREILLEQIHEKQQGSTILFSSHDEEFIAAASATRWHLSDGQLRLM